ncbi:titin [Pectinophora gossypiella]|uniref:titin n=1 Tax=Pectinophora gossypiella TaxID=13191 RepID=UPI00214E7636|nr:titin [Pectinophora gossypiella]
MNAKKNKNKQKQNKPNPQPKAEEIIGETPEKLELEEKIEVVKSEERVPEIVSETAPVSDAKISEGDTPKKPKRNRGKKKKTDKEDETDDIQEQKVPEPVTEEVKQTSDEQGNKEPNKAVEEKGTDLSEIAPAARKKKNKNKKQSEQAEKASEQEIKITPLTKEELTDVKIVTCVPVATESAEESKSKKKNKKKKRSDSERSDKADEVAACTAAFQKLLEYKDEKKDVKKETKLEDIIPATEESTPKEQEVIPVQIETKIISEKGVIQDEIVEEKPHETKVVTKEEGGKSKKKNKKDKKHPPKMEGEDLEVEQKYIEDKTEVLTTENPTESRSSTNVAAENILEIKGEPVIHLEDTHKSSEKPNIEKEKSPKPKAKIAKPVEKKRKGKGDNSSTEVLIEESSVSVSTPEDSTVTAETTKEHKEDTTAEKREEIKDVAIEVKIDTSEKEMGHIGDPADKQDIKSEVKEQIETMTKETETIQMPETSKKRRKSPKPKTVDTLIKEPAAPTMLEATIVEPKPTKSDETKENILPSKETVAKKDEIKAILEIKTEIIEEKPTAALEPEPPVLQPNVPIALGFEPIIPTKTTSEARILATPEVGKMPELPTELVLETEGQHIPIPEPVMGKKRKKSPKPPRKLNKTPEPTEKVSEPVSAPEQSTKDITNEQKIKTETGFDLLPMEDIEIRSMKASESEGSACDITPDVQYPRASSQLLDDNNNTTIRDVTDIKLNIPFELPDTPLIQGSGETPLTPPKLNTTGIKFTEVLTEPEPVVQDFLPSKSETEIKSKPNEKTDLKSKVLDVNIGMEELRKSIERSLAELTSMERSERDAEEQFASAQSKLQEITELASKKTECDKKILPAKDNTKIEKRASTPVQTKEADKYATSGESKPVPQVEESKANTKQVESTVTDIKPEEQKIGENPVQAETPVPPAAPICPARKENKGKGKRKKGKQDAEHNVVTPTSTTCSESSATTSTTTGSETKESTKDTKKDDKSNQKNTGQTQEKGKQQSDFLEETNSPCGVLENAGLTDSVQMGFEPIDSFEDALTSSVDDVNKTFEMIANESNTFDQSQNPEINVISPVDDEDNSNDKKDANEEKINPISQPKNLLGHPDIPARLNKTDYKKEKNKSPNTKQARVKIKDSVPIEMSKESKESQTENNKRFMKDKTVTESISSVRSDNEEYIYKYSFRKVFLPSACHVCKKDLKQTRVPCNFCSLVFYCSAKHKDEDYPQHQALCFAVSTIVHLKDQKHIYAEAKNITGHEYRLLRMQMIVSCEKVLKRRLVPWEQEALLYPRMCADAACREWRQSKLVDCEGCGQVSFCADHPDHLPKSHQRWCKSYSLYHRLVVYQQTKGRLEPKLPSRVMAELYQIPEKLNEVLASMYEEKIDMTDIQYAALTQIATAPLTAAYCQQLFTNKMNSIYANGMHKKASFTIHVVGAELQFEADALNKWEVFFLHLRPDVKDLRVVLLGPDLNPSRLPLDLLGKINLCENCRQNKRRVLFEFQDKKTYHEYWSTDFTTPDLVCAFNPSIQRSSIFNGKDTWPSTIKCILKLRIPFIITSYTMNELLKDLARIKECFDGPMNAISEPKYNSFASVRPDRNFITDDEMPLLFKNFCFAIVCGSS